MRYHLASVLVATAALAACGPTVSIQRAPDARIAHGARWAWGPPDRDGLTLSEGALVPADSLVRMMSDAIEAELRAKGYARTTPESAQFIVHFHVGRRDVTDTMPPRDDPPQGALRAPNPWGGYGRPEDLDERVVTWQEGMLIIDALDAQRGIVAWRGIIAGEVPERAAAHPAPAMREGVRRLLRGFP